MSGKFKYIVSLIERLNKLLPKFQRFVLIGFPDTESSIIEVANYIVENYKMPVYLKVEQMPLNISKYSFINPHVKLIKKGLFFWLTFMTSKYIFFTHGATINNFSKRQVVVNIWHGILFKKVGILIGSNPIFANLTVATSEFTQKMFSEAFGVPLKDVIVCGYPRNDIMIRANKNKINILDNLCVNLLSYSNIVIWLPTYRKSIKGNIRLDGKEVGNPFYIENFDIYKFNEILKNNNSICIVKPHPMAPKYNDITSLSNLLFIDDNWILYNNITLYHLLGCCDILISDVSSVMADFLLLDKPIICFSNDILEYGNSRGFYFEDIDNWLPSKVINQQEDLFIYLNYLLKTGIDSYEIKRKNIKNEFFTFFDAGSTARLMQHVFNF